LNIAHNGVVGNRVTATMPPGNPTADDAAGLIANYVNSFTNSNIATNSGGKVQMAPGWELSLDNGTTPGVFKLNGSKGTDLAPLKLSLAPDFQSGGSTLVSDGHFGSEGPLGLSNFFTAHAGTSDTQLADLFANSINTAAGYSAYAVGSDVFFTPPVGDVFFTVDGSPLEYSLSVVPEPATLGTMSLGSAALMFFAIRRKRRRSLRSKSE